MGADTPRKKATDITPGSASVLDHNWPAAIKREKSQLFCLHKRVSSDGGRQKARPSPRFPSARLGFQPKRTVLRPDPESVCESDANRDVTTARDLSLQKTSNA